jgi:hypothetical protein
MGALALAQPEEVPSLGEFKSLLNLFLIMSNHTIPDNKVHGLVTVSEESTRDSFSS